jgi:streptomycin 6-kinase
VDDETIARLVQPREGATREELAMSRWYRRLSRSDRAHVQEIVVQAVDEAVSGVLRILEDVRDIERDETADVDLSFVVSEATPV